MKKLSLFLAALLSIGLFFSSCVKDAKTVNPGYKLDEVGTNTTSMLELPMDVYLQADRAIRSQHDSIVAKSMNQASYTYTIDYISYTVAPADLTTYPKTITVNFGTTTTNPYTGTMTVKVNGDMYTAGNTCALTYTNLVTTGSTIKGNDSIFSLGLNSSGSYNYRFKVQNGEVLGYNSEKISYSGNVYPKFNSTTKAYVMDSVLLNGSDAGLNSYKMYSHKTYKLQKLSTCNYFNTGAINAEITVGGVMVGSMAFDFSYSTTGVTGDCDAYGAIYANGQNSYQNSFAFLAKKFQ
jgi:hypothetical protein